MAVEVFDDRLDAHLSGFAVPFQGEPIDEADRSYVERINLQLLLDLGSAPLGRDGAIADRRQRTEARPQSSTPSTQPATKTGRAEACSLGHVLRPWTVT